MKLTKKQERILMVKAMEYIARQINAEDIFLPWLSVGVADGDIEYGDLSPDPGEAEYYAEEDTFKELMDCFMRRMVLAYKDGGLYCGGVAGGEKED